MPAGKIHWIRERREHTHPIQIMTHCGREGTAEGCDEWSTVQGDRFEATEGLRTVNCKRCLKSYERISNGPWGCKRASAIQR